MSPPIRNAEEKPLQGGDGVNIKLRDTVVRKRLIEMRDQIDSIRNTLSYLKDDSEFPSKKTLSVYGRVCKIHQHNGDMM